MMDSASPRDMNRDRNRRGERQSRFSDAGGSNSDRDRDRSHERRGGGGSNRIYVSNIPYEFRWQDLKDLCRELVGDVNFVELFNDESGKPRGCGIVEFKGNDCVAVAMEKMNRHEINGRHLVIKEDHGDQRDACGRVIRGGGGGGGGGGSLGGGNNGGGRDRDIGGGNNNNNNSSNRMSSGGGFNNSNNRDRDDDRPRPLGGGGGGGGLGNMGGGPGGNNLGGLGSSGGGGPMGDFDSPYNTYGLSTSFLEGLGIQGPLYNKIFIANLDYKVDAKKLKQVFKLAGRIVSVDLSSDKDGNSRGFAVVEYDHPVEAVQAISMFDRQTLFDRRMTVRLDRIPDKGEGLKLPDGLKGVGIGLGPNGEPLKNVAYNLRNMNNNQAAPATPINNGGVNSVGVQNPSAAAAAAAAASAAASLLGPAPNNALGGLNNLAAFNSVISNLSGTLGNPLTNPLLNSASLSSLQGLSALANSASSGVNSGANDNQNNQQGGGGGGGGGGFNSSQGFQSAYSTPVFNTNLAALRSRNDYDQGNNSNSVRSYSTQDYGNQRQNAFGNSVSSNNNAFGNNNNNSVSNQRKSDTVIIKNLPPSCNWQLLRDKFREMGEVKHAEMHSPDTGIVRFAAEKDAELAIKIMDGARFDNQTVYVSFF